MSNIMKFNEELRALMLRHGVTAQWDIVLASEYAAELQFTRGMRVPVKLEYDSRHPDTALLDHLQDVARKSVTGVSVDYVKHVEEGVVTDRGYRLMHRKHIGEPCKSIRDAIRTHLEKQQ